MLWYVHMIELCDLEYMDTNLQLSDVHSYWLIKIKHGTVAV